MTSLHVNSVVYGLRFKSLGNKCEYESSINKNICPVNVIICNGLAGFERTNCCGVYATCRLLPTADPTKAESLLCFALLATTSLFKFADFVGLPRSSTAYPLWLENLRSDTS